MLFLLNDVVLNLDPHAVSSAAEINRHGALKLKFINELAQEVYADEPLLHQVNPVRARRLACLIVAKAPEINAALLIAPTRGCSPELVSVRYAQVDFELMSHLAALQNDGELSTLHADRQVWRRLAA